MFYGNILGVSIRIIPKHLEVKNKFCKFAGTRQNKDDQSIIQQYRVRISIGETRKPNLSMALAKERLHKSSLCFQDDTLCN